MERLAGGSFCSGAGGGRLLRPAAGASRCWRRRLTISSPPVSFRFRSWSGCSMARRRSAGQLLRRLRPAFATGWWFGFGYFLAGLWWIGGALLVEADSFAWALPFAVFGIPLLLAFFYGFAAARRAAVLDQRYRPHRRAGLRLRARRMAARLPVHRLSLERRSATRRCRCRC